MPKAKPSSKRTRRPDPKRTVAAKKKPTRKAAVPKKKARAKPTTVDGFVQTLPPPMQVMVNKLRALVAAASPEATEAFKWAQPVYEASGPFAYIKAFKGYLNFGFWRGAVLDAPGDLLEGDGERMRHLKITALADIDDALIQSLVRQAVLLNSRLGDPSK